MKILGRVVAGKDPFEIAIFSREVILSSVTASNPGTLWSVDKGSATTRQRNLKLIWDKKSMPVRSGSKRQAAQQR